MLISTLSYIAKLSFCIVTLIWLRELMILIIFLQPEVSSKDDTSPVRMRALPWRMSVKVSEGTLL